MKQILVMMAVVVVLVGQSVEAADKSIADQMIENIVRRISKKPTGQLTKADFDNIMFFTPSDPVEPNQFDDAILKEVVTKFPNLQAMMLSGGYPKITDAGLKEVAKLQKLTHLYLAGTKITDAGLKEVAKLQKLELLDLNGQGKITVAGLMEVAKLQNLTSLYLNRTRTNDAGLKEVAKLQKLKHLDLGKCPITEASLKDVAKLQKLEQLNLYPNAWAKDNAGVAELKRALPNCKIKAH